MNCYSRQSVLPAVFILVTALLTTHIVPVPDAARTAHLHAPYLRCFAVHSYRAAFAALGPVSGNAAACAFTRLLAMSPDYMCSQQGNIEKKSRAVFLVNCRQYVQYDFGLVRVRIPFGLCDITSRRGNERASFADRVILHARCAGMIMQDANQRK